MPVEIITKEDLEQFRKDLLKDLAEIIQKNKTNFPKLVKPAEIRKMLGCISPGSLQNLRIYRALPYIKLSDGLTLYDVEKVNKWIKENEFNIAEDR